MEAELEEIGRIKSIPTILEVICSTTGMGVAAVARVTEHRWIACSVLDRINFGLEPGGELAPETTICHEILRSKKPIVIDNVAEDDIWCQDTAPKKYEFQSYISVPIVLADSSFFGTLCALDPHPHHLKRLETIGMFELFAELISKHLNVDHQLAATASALVEERATAKLREQFIAVLGHDLRTPMRAITSFSELMLRSPLDESAAEMARLILGSAIRMNGLIDNLLDLARGRLAHGLTLKRDADQPLEPTLRAVITELRVSQPNRIVETHFAIQEPIDCDRARVAQLFSNLLSNALTYGSADQPVVVRAQSDGNTFELSVSNFGPPIPANILTHLFEPFYRTGSIHEHQGLGLGLYISDEIARAHGGTLDVSSTNEKTCFTFRMPIVK